MKNFIILISAAFLLVSCVSKSSQIENNQASDSLKLFYAKGFAIKYFADYKEVIVYSPWVKGTEYARYFLVKDAAIKTPAGGTKILIPLQTLAATSVTHFEFLSLLGELQTVNAVCSPKIIYN